MNYLALKKGQYKLLSNLTFFTYPDNTSVEVLKDTIITVKPEGVGIPNPITSIGTFGNNLNITTIKILYGNQNVLEKLPDSPGNGVSGGRRKRKQHKTRKTRKIRKQKHNRKSRRTRY